ncbi:hypothetical protein EVAR_28550_1 [Eumeta japonica]|uniref:Uncharacterized protein n=1 Tax=Eumeta variegata TaxID=151549 RepID=A0A4C1UXD9_EUMVA|nr:hypothetical protein EVAR_28550_1 [Eumeta japonica]
MYYCIAAIHTDASLTQVGERQMSHADERGGRLCLSVARSALSLALQALNGTSQSEGLSKNYSDIHKTLHDCRRRKRMKASEQINDGVSILAAEATEAMQVDNLIAFISMLDCMDID